MKKATHIIEEGTIRATIVIEENVKNGNTVAQEKVLEVDEIKNYLNCRFLAPCEAVWRLFSFDIHYLYLKVMQLSFHLPNQNAITLRDSEKLPALLRKEGIDVTMFTDWFELNKVIPQQDPILMRRFQSTMFGMKRINSGNKGNRGNA
ncbi:hypothetical protein Tco_0041666 [Tanacetum coccineum]